jgi:hypothetical protein
MFTWRAKLNLFIFLTTLYFIMANKSFSNFLCFSAGIDTEVLSKCPPIEQMKMKNMGVFVLIPASLALFSGSFAATYLYENDFMRYFFPIVFAGLIYTFDRAIVMHTKFGERNFSILPRLVVSVLLSLLLTEPVLLRLFKDKIVADENRRISEIESRADSLIEVHNAPLYVQMRKNDSLLDALENKRIDEMAGISGTGIRGKGPVSEEEKIAFNRRLEKAKSDSAFITYKILAKKKKIEEIAQLEKNAIASDLSGKLETLSQLSDSSPPVWYTTWLFRLLLIVLDLLPILWKLFPINSNELLYDELLQQKHDAIREANRKSQTIGNQNIDTAIEHIYKHDLSEIEIAHLQQQQADMKQKIEAIRKGHYETDQAKRNAVFSIQNGHDPQLAKKALDKLGDN